MAGALDLRGEKFGKLKPLAIIERHDRGALWICECSCGRFAKRYAAVLLKSRRDGSVSMCRKCLYDLVGETIESRRDQRKAHFAKMARSGRSLYSERFDRSFRADIMRDLECEFGEMRDESFPGFDYQAIRQCIGSFGHPSGSYQDVLNEQVDAAFLRKGE
jgi:hypothetical protein